MWGTVQLLLQPTVINLHLFQRQISLHTDFRITAISLPSPILYSLFVAYPLPTPTHLLVCANNLLLTVSLFTFSSTFLCSLLPAPTDHSKIMKNRSSVQSLPSVNKHVNWLLRHAYSYTKTFFRRFNVVFIGRSMSIFRTELVPWQYADSAPSNFHTIWTLRATVESPVGLCVLTSQWWLNLWRRVGC